MFFKTLIASILAALLAGSVVYFGAPGTPTTSQSVALRTTPSVHTTQKQPERWIDEFVTNPLRKAVRPSRQDKPDTSKPETDDRPADTPQDPVATPDSPSADVSTQTDTAPKDDPTAPRYYVLENGELREIDALPGPTTADAINPDASFKILTVSEQAKQIEQPDLRDRAFLDIVDYAVSEALYTAAVSAMEEIAQVELRDTARSRISIAYAKAGDSRAAFTLIDDVEVDELRDVLRLQVIEAMILPERLPPGLQ